jgi:hypothetical protein
VSTYRATRVVENLLLLDGKVVVLADGNACGLGGVTAWWNAGWMQMQMQKREEKQPAVDL